VQLVDTEVWTYNRFFGTRHFLLFVFLSFLALLNKSGVNSVPSTAAQLAFRRVACVQSWKEDIPLSPKIDPCEASVESCT
jgi:hypothetical protein